MYRTAARPICGPTSAIGQIACSPYLRRQPGVICAACRCSRSSCGRWQAIIGGRCRKATTLVCCTPCSPSIGGSSSCTRTGRSRWRRIHASSLMLTRSPVQRFAWTRRSLSGSPTFSTASSSFRHARPCTRQEWPAASRRSMFVSHSARPSCASYKSHRPCRACPPSPTYRARLAQRMRSCTEGLGSSAAISVPERCATLHFLSSSRRATVSSAPFLRRPLTPTRPRLSAKPTSSGRRMGLAWSICRCCLRMQWRSRCSTAATFPTSMHNSRCTWACATF
mmetsp:Transcript_14389/g.37338  ORF Transcript_14389/g.37338 Transcript_14389/m.37338 type:complete len:280 (-) Transcript_14389:632-1471(-)